MGLIDPQGLFESIVGLPVLPKTGTDFVTAANTGPAGEPFALVAELALAVRADAKRVGAVALHQLTGCSVAGVHGTDRSDVFWDGAYQLQDGSRHVPAPGDAPCFVSDSDVAPALSEAA